MATETNPGQLPWTFTYGKIGSSVMADPIPNGLGDQRQLVEGVEIGEVHPAAPDGPRLGLVGYPLQVQRDGQPVA
ncbi:hypothetical protein [Streptacidiphilus griseoplanus]|uniref:hypothetical protein n=1 Tax=Peterkaempfera griseoplana TaxID=66896 RepID=UPI00158C839F|nr:hypothetical protein [Peterkaempfera griseoplana]